MPAEQAASPVSMLIPYLLIFLIFYFLVIRPQKTKQNEHKNMLANLKKNDRVVTSGGIHGTVTNVKDKTVLLRVDDGTRIEFDKEAVASLVSSAEDKKS